LKIREHNDLQTYQLVVVVASRAAVVVAVGMLVAAVVAAVGARVVWCGVHDIAAVAVGAADAVVVVAESRDEHDIAVGEAAHDDAA